MRYAVVFKKNDKIISIADFVDFKEALNYSKEVKDKLKNKEIEVVKHFYPLYL